MRDTEEHFGGAAGSPLHGWREVLSELSDHGRHAAFSTPFTKLKGLEITTPIIQSFSVTPMTACAGTPVAVVWEATANPPETQAFLVHIPTVGSPTKTTLPALNGSMPLELPPGRGTLQLLLERELNGEVFIDRSDIQVLGVTGGADWRFVYKAVPRAVDS